MPKGKLAELIEAYPEWLLLERGRGAVELRGPLHVLVYLTRQELLGLRPLTRSGTRSSVVLWTHLPFDSKFDTSITKCLSLKRLCRRDHIAEWPSDQNRKSKKVVYRGYQFRVEDECCLVEHFLSKLMASIDTWQTHFPTYRHPLSESIPSHGLLRLHRKLGFHPRCSAVISGNEMGSSLLLSPCRRFWKGNRIPEEMKISLDKALADNKMKVDNGDPWSASPLTLTCFGPGGYYFYKIGKVTKGYNVSRSLHEVLKDINASDIVAISLGPRDSWVLQFLSDGVLDIKTEGIDSALDAIVKEGGRGKKGYNIESLDMDLTSNGWFLRLGNRVSYSLNLSADLGAAERSITQDGQRTVHQVQFGQQRSWLLHHAPTI